MTLPIDRTALTAAQTNQVPNALIRSALNIAALTTPYNTIDELYNYTSNLVAGGVLQPYPAFLSRQALINGNFDVWQRGTSFTNPSSTSYYTDRFLLTVSVDGGVLPTTITHSRLSMTPGDVQGLYYGYRINVNGAGSAFGANAIYALSQKIENGTRYLCGAGKKVTVSFWAKSDIAGKRFGVNIVQRYGTGGTPTANEVLTGTIFTLSSTWTKYTCTLTTNTLAGKTFGTNNDDVLQLQLLYGWGTTTANSSFGGGTAETFVGAGNIDIAQVQVNAGDQALPFQPKDIDDETKKSLRFAWVPQTNSVFVRLTSYTANTLVFNVPLPVQMRVAPTIRGVVNTDIIAYNMSGVAQTGFTGSTSYSSDGVAVTLTKTAHGLTDAYLEIKTTSGFDAEL